MTPCILILVCSQISEGALKLIMFKGSDIYLCTRVILQKVYICMYILYLITIFPLLLPFKDFFSTEDNQTQLLENPYAFGCLPFKSGRSKDMSVVSSSDFIQKYFEEYSTDICSRIGQYYEVY